MGGRQQANDISFRWVAIAAAIVTTVSGLYVLLAWALDATDRGALPAPWPTIPEEINELEVSRFDETTAAERSVAPARKRLESFGWIDQQKAVVHIPIDTAIDIYLDRSTREDR